MLPSSTCVPFPVNCAILFKFWQYRTARQLYNARYIYPTKTGSIQAWTPQTPSVIINLYKISTSQKPVCPRISNVFNCESQPHNRQKLHIDCTVCWWVVSVNQCPRVGPWDLPLMFLVRLFSSSFSLCVFIDHCSFLISWVAVKLRSWMLLFNGVMEALWRKMYWISFSSPTSKASCQTHTTIQKEYLIFH